MLGARCLHISTVLILWLMGALPLERLLFVRRHVGVVSREVGGRAGCSGADCDALLIVLIDHSVCLVY